MSTLTGRVVGVAQDLFIASSRAVQVVGEQAVTADGRKFRYVAVEPSASGVTGQATGASLVAGNLIQSNAAISNHLALTPSAASAIGDTTVTVTLGATAAYVNQYAGGYMLISTGPGNGIAYRIKSHPLAAASATLLLTLEDAFLVATTTASRMDLQQNIYWGVLQNPTTASGLPIGSAQWALPSLTTGGATGQNFGWIQTHGMSATLCQGTPAAGAAVMPSTTTAGAVAVATAGTPVVGAMATTAVNGKNNAVYLMID